jgi:hypothetical protein
MCNIQHLSIGIEKDNEKYYEIYLNREKVV